MQLRKEAIISLHPDIVHRSEPFGGVLFNLETKAFHPVNEPGYRLIQLLDTHPSVGQLESKIQEWYTSALSQPIAEAQAEDICTMFLDELHHRQLIQGYPQEDEVRPPNPSTTASPLPAHLKLKAPLVVSLSTLFTCNLFCTHCYVGSTSEIRPDNFTVEELCQILTRLKELEVFDVVITGGEPLLLKGIFEVLQHAKSLGLYICLNTNGTIVTPRIAQRLRDIGVDCVKVSIDSANAAVHDRFRGQVGAFRRSMRGIAHLVRAGVRTDIHTVLSVESTGSEQDIDAMVTLAESLGVRKVHFGRLFSTGRGEDQQKIAQAHLLRLIDYLEELKMRNPLIGRTPSKSMPCVPSIPSYDGCGGCARGVYAYISYNGGVYPCTNLYKSEWLLGNLREQDFTGIWEHSPVLADLRTRLSTVSTSMGEAFHD